MAKARETRGDPRRPTDLRRDIVFCARYLEQFYANTALGAAERAGAARGNETRPKSIVEYGQSVAATNRELVARRALARERVAEWGRRLGERLDALDNGGGDVHDFVDEFYHHREELWPFENRPVSVLDEARRVLDLPPETPLPSGTRTDFLGSLRSLMRAYGDRVSIEPADSAPWFNLVLHTKDIRLDRPGYGTRHYIGVLKIRFRLHGLVPVGPHTLEQAVRVETTHKHYAVERPNYLHPHVSGGGGMCIGEGKRQIWNALVWCDLLTAMRSIERTLERCDVGHNGDGYFGHLVEVCRVCDKIAPGGTHHGVCGACCVTVETGHLVPKSEATELDGKMYRIIDVLGCPATGKRFVRGSKDAVAFDGLLYHRDGIGVCEFSLHIGAMANSVAAARQCNIVEIDGHRVMAGIIPWLVAKEKVHGTAWKEAAAEALTRINEGVWREYPTGGGRAGGRGAPGGTVRTAPGAVAGTWTTT